MGQRASTSTSASPSPSVPRSSLVPSLSRPFHAPNPNFELAASATIRTFPPRVKWDQTLKPLHFKPDEPRATTPPAPFLFTPAQRDIHLSSTFAFLTLADLCSLSGASVFLYTETTSDRVWLRWLRRDFPAMRSIREPTLQVECGKDDEWDDMHMHVNNSQEKHHETKHTHTQTPTHPHTTKTNNTKPNKQHHSDNNHNHQQSSNIDDNTDNKSEIQPVLSDADERALLRAIRVGDVSLASRLASEAAQRASLSTIGVEAFIAPVDPLLALFAAELAAHPQEERIRCTAWDGSDGSTKTCKQRYEDEIRRHYDPCLTSHQALAEYLLARQELIDGLTSMCRQPHVGSAMEIKTRGLRETWPNVHLSCKLHFDYLRSFYFAWHGIRSFNARLDHERLRAINSLHAYQPVVTSNGDIELQLTLSIPAFSNERDRATSIASGIAAYREILGMEQLVDLLGGKQYIRVVQVVQIPGARTTRWGRSE